MNKMGESWNKIQLAGIKSIIVVRLFVRYKSAHSTTTFFLFIPNNSISRPPGRSSLITHRNEIIRLIHYLHFNAVH